jgi:hypothetical protein
VRRNVVANRRKSEKGRTKPEKNVKDRKSERNCYRGGRRDTYEVGLE